MVIAHNCSPEKCLPERGTIEREPVASVVAQGCFGKGIHAASPHQTRESISLELFRRAVILHDEEAWASIYRHYEPVVRVWVSEQCQPWRVLGQEHYAPMIHGAFANLVLALTPARMERLGRFPPVLRYLKRCAYSAVREEADVRVGRLHECPLEAVTREDPDPADSILSQICAQGLWQAIWDELPEDQRVLLALTCQGGLKPAEIVSRYHQRFPSVEKVYRVKHTALQRIRRSRRVQRYLKALRET